MRIWTFFLLLFIFTACKHSQNDGKQTDNKTTISYAKHFNIVDHLNYKELQILNPETGKIEKQYALVKRNSNVQIPADLQKIEIPLKSIVTLSGTYIGMLEKLKLADKITGISNKKYLANPTVLKGCNAGKVLEFEDFGILNPERVLKSNSKMIMYSGFEGTAPPNEDKLVKLGVLCVPNYDWKENHPLGKAEWIKVFGLLFDQDLRADTYFNEIEKQYNNLKTEAKKYTKKPTVFSGMVFGDSWYMPAGESFGATFFKDAGADYVAKNEKGTGSVAYSFEKTFTANQHTQFWLNVEVPSKKALLQANEKYKLFDAYAKDEIYSYAYNMNFFWENSAIEPHLVLADLIQIFHGGKYDASKLHFYRQLTE